MKVRTVARTGRGLRVGVLLAAASLAGISAPASADEVDDVIAKLQRAADVSSALAVEQGGYSLVIEQSWVDGTSERQIGNYTVDNSASYFRETKLPNGKVTKSGYISDRRAKTYSWSAGRDKETRKALQLLRADADSWIVKAAPRGINVHTIRSRPAGFWLAYWLPPLTEFSYQVISDDGQGRIAYSLRGSAPETKESRYEVSVTLGSDGTISAMQATDVTIGATKKITWAYVAPVIEQPTGSAVIKKADFERAKQAPELMDKIQYFAFRAGVKMSSPSPAKLFEKARSEVVNWPGDKLLIPIKVSKIKWGAQLAAVNPFTKERHECELVVDSPGSTGIWCRSGAKPWTALQMCTNTGCIESLWQPRSGHLTAQPAMPLRQRPLEARDVRALRL